MLIAMAGLPGVGKSTLARRIAGDLPAILVDKDQVRLALFPPDTIEYSSQQDDLCVSIMFQVAEYLLRGDPRRSVILDGRTFSRRYQVAELVGLAHGLGVPLKILECVCSDATARARLEHDAATSAHVARNRSYELYQAIKARFEPIAAPKLVVDTDRPLEECLALCIAYLRADG